MRNRTTSFIKSTLVMTAIALSANVFALETIQDDIDSIRFQLKSEQIYTLKNYGQGQYKELAFTRIEKPNLKVGLNKKSATETLEVAIDESLLVEKNSLVHIKLEKNNLVNIESANDKAAVLTKLKNNGLGLDKNQAAKILKKDIIANLNRVIAKIGFRDNTKVSYEIKNLAFNCPSLKGRITNCRGKYDVIATLKNEKKKTSNLSEILINSTKNLNNFGSEIDINAYIGELRSINKQLNKLSEGKPKGVDLKKLYALKKDVQSEILDSYQYTAIATSSARDFLTKLNSKLN
ncbi:hypothetical protein ABMA70_01050 [Halobacteriovorax sp. XZX-3]|uniref:hypothetical protein n=1 Tax=unclassified Halobacteriovorax TaxID=2639665 RepID=UPI000CD2274C|nr:hypothetical protein [Halobacteriovorax sp. DA5]POB14354.1 hypothetical protein C0Z22_04480 [Halobacteriovorax sp. DA5]